MCIITNDILYGRAALALGEPWIVPESLVLLKSIIQSDWEVFEWGSGGSTVFWSKRCKFIVSIEHNSDWITRTTALLQRHICKDNWLLHYVPGEDIDHRTAFRKYADSITKLGPRKFDLIYIDGEASCRDRCLEHALSRVRVGGYLLLDNSDWLKDHDFGTAWERQDFVAENLKWVGLPGVQIWWTSILRKVS